MWKILRFLLNLALVLAVIAYIPGVPPYGDLKAYNYAPIIPLEGPLAPNFIINGAEKLFESEIVGPEAMQVSREHPGELYTGLADGSVARLSLDGKRIEHIVRFGEQTTKYWQLEKSGRPLGVRYDHEGNLLVADAYYGIFKVFPKTGNYTNLVSKTNVISGKTAKFFNAAISANDGKIYWTDTSSNYPFHEGVGEVLGNPSGRLICYDPRTGDNEVLLENLHFANGLVLSPDEDFILVVECFQYRVVKYWLKGPKKGSSEVFIEGLPGTPDNLSLSPDGNILVGLITVRIPDAFNPIDFLGRRPLLRKLVLRILHLVKFPLDLAAKFFDLSIAKQLSFHVMNLETVRDLTPEHAMIIKIDWNGKILKSWHSNSKSLRFYSEGIIEDGYLYLGSLYNEYLGRVKLDNL